MAEEMKKPSVIRVEELKPADVSNVDTAVPTGMEKNVLKLQQSYPDPTMYKSVEANLENAHSFSALYREDPLKALEEIEESGVLDYGINKYYETQKKKAARYEQKFNEFLEAKAGLGELEKTSNTLKHIQNEQVTALSALSVKLAEIDPEESVFNQTQQAMIAKQDAALQYANEFSMRRFKKGVAAGLGEFADSAISTAGNNLASVIMDSGADRYVSLAEDYASLLADSTLTPDEFITRLDDIYSEAADAGWFTENNEFIFNSALSVILEAGYEGPNTRLEQGWKYFDIATTVSPAALLKGAKAAGTAVKGTGKAITGGKIVKSAIKNASEELQKEVDTLIKVTDDVPTISKGKLLVTEVTEEAVPTTAKVVDDEILKESIKIGSIKPVEKIEKFFGRETAESFAINIVKGSSDDTQISTAYTPSTFNAGEFSVESYTSPHMNTARALEAEVNAQRLVDNLDFGKVLTKEEREILVREATVELKESYKTFGNQRVLNHGLSVDNSGNFYGNLILGKDDTSYFLTPESASNLADMMGGEVVKVMSNGAPKYGVKIIKNIDASKYLSETDWNSIKTGLVREWFGSSARTIGGYYDVILKRGESAASAMISQLNKAFNKAYKKASKEERAEMEQFEKWLDQSDFQYLKGDVLSEPQFKKLFSEFSGGSKLPSEAQTELFKVTRKLQWERFLLETNPMLERAVANNEEMLTLSGQSYRAKKTRIDNVDGLVYDFETKSYIDVTDIREGSVFEIHNAAFTADGKNVRYVLTRTPLTRGLRHTDMMGMHYALPRMYRDNLKYFVKQGYDIALGGGGNMKGVANTFMGVNTAKQAQKAVDQINNIVKELGQRLTSTEGLSKTDFNQLVRTLDGDQTVLSVIRSNNEWNTGIESIEDLVKFAEDTGIDLRNTVDFVEDGGSLDGAANFAARNVTEEFGKKMQSTRRKGSKVLMGFNGEANELVDPYKALNVKVTSASVRAASQSYITRAGNQLIASIKADGKLGQLGAGSSIIDVLRNTTINTATPKGRQAALMRNQILARAGEKDASTKYFEGLANDLSEKMYDLGFTRGGRLADKFATDPTAWARGIAFDLRLGMFAIDQVYVQASQVVVASAITSGTLGMKGTVKAAASFKPFVAAMLADTPEKVAEIAKAQASVFGRSEEEFIGLVEWAKSTGRFTVDQTVAEGSGDLNRAMGTFDKVRQQGRMFFNAGEATSRGMSLILAHDEALVKARRAGTKFDLNDENISNAIFDRQDVLTGRMTRASASKVQTGLASIPTQFMTYNFRMIEQLLLGGDLTKAERARLSTALLFMYGTAGAPTLGIATYATNKFFGESDEDLGIPSLGLDEAAVYTLIKGGATDYFLSTITGVDTALSGRLGVDKGMYDLYVKMFEDRDFYEIMTGPVGATAKDIFTTVKDGFAKALDPDLNYSSDDVIKAFRNFSSFDKGTKAFLIFKYGEYLSKKRGKLATNLDVMDGIATALGVPLQEVNIVWDAKKELDRDRKYLSDIRARVVELEDLWVKAVDNGDYEKADRLSTEKAILMQPLDWDDRVRLVNDLSNSWQGMDETIYKQINKNLTTEEGRQTIFSRRFGDLLFENKLNN